MSDEHKAALEAGRSKSRKVKAFLVANKQRNAPKKRGRKRSLEAIQSRLEAIQLELVDADVLKEVQLIQEEANLERELKEQTGTNLSDGDFEALRQDFILVALDYSVAKGIARSTWRKVGVDAKTLTDAGIK